MKHTGYYIVPHTADVRLSVSGRGMPGLFKNAARGLLALTGLSAGSGGKRIKVGLEAGDAEALLVGWLNELLYVIQTKRFCPAEVRVTRCDGKHLEAELEGEYCFKLKRMPVSREVKAATYSGLKIISGKKLLRATILFDI